MAKPVTFGVLTYNDNTMKSNGEPETASFSWAMPTATPANIAAQDTLVDNIVTAVNAVTLGVLGKREHIYERLFISRIRAASTSAQRENKWLVRYHGNITQDKFQLSIPTADLSLLPDGSEFLDITAGVGLALADALEAALSSPNDTTETITVDSVQFVGRNS